MPKIVKKLGGRPYRKFVQSKPTAVRKAFKKGGSFTKTVTRRRRFKSKKAYRNKKIRQFKRKKYIQKLADTSPWIVSCADYPLQSNIASGAVQPYSLLTTGYCNTLTNATVTNVTPIVCQDGNYRCDLNAAMQIARNGVPLGGQDINIDKMKYKIQIRNNGNIACNIRYYRFHPRRSHGDAAFDTFQEVYAQGLVDAGIVSNTSPLMLDPFKLDYITSRYLIKTKFRRLLPGEKWVIYYQVPIRGIRNTTALIDRPQNWYTAYHGLLSYGDPCHDVNTNQVTTSQATLDMIVSYYIKVKKISDNTHVKQTIATDNLPALVNAAEFVAAFANAATAFSG